MPKVPVKALSLARSRSLLSRALSHPVSRSLFLSLSAVESNVQGEGNFTCETALLLVLHHRLLLQRAKIGGGVSQRQI